MWTSNVPGLKTVYPVNMISALCAIVSLTAQETLTPVELRVELLKPLQQPGLAKRLVQWFSDPTLDNGSGVKTNGLDVAWAVRATGATRPPQIVRQDGEPPIKMVRIGESDLYAAASDFPEGTGFSWEFAIGDVAIGKWHNLEVYNSNPDNEYSDSVAHGVLSQQPPFTSTVFATTSRNWWTYIPAGSKASDELPVMIFQDGQWAKDYIPNVLDNLIARKEIPALAAIFLEPGKFPDGKSDRSREYDTLSDAYSHFLLDEILPEFEKKQKLKHDPASRALAGLSSGGICSFTAAWEHPEAFGKVMSWVGSFTDIAHGSSLKEGGHNYPFLIRLSEKKPIRVFLQDGYNDLDNQFGSWWLANQQMARALEFKGYDYRFVGGEGFHSDLHGRAILPETLKWLWRP
jgi:enterochelin esterase family protein